MLTGVPSIDREHDALLVQLNRLLDNPQTQPASDSFSEVLSCLGTQIVAHFDSEENILKSCGMPAEEVAAHVRAHTEILEQYARMNCDLMDGKAPTRPEALCTVKNWIIDHLWQYDSKIAGYFQPQQLPR